MPMEKKSFSLFWGCTIPLRMPWIEKTARVVLPRLGVDIVDLPFSCCPDPIASKAMDHNSWIVLAARNLALAESQDLDILSMCTGCFETLKIAQHELKDKNKRSEINEILKSVNRVYEGKTRVFHIQEWLYNEFGLANLSESVIHPLKFKVGTHVGCHYTRPADVLQTDNPLYPEQLDELTDILGMESVDYPDKNLCCGVGVGLVDRNITKSLIERKIDGLHRAGAQALVAHCPSCIQTYDLGQTLIEKDPVPVFHYFELLGLALGISPEEMAFQDHKIPVTSLIDL